MNDGKTQDAGVATDSALTSGSECQCVNWCDLTLTHRMLTNHHENCEHSPDALKCALKLIADMARGIELWAAEEDGVYDECWEPYRKAKSLEGKFLPPNDSAQPPGA